MVKFYTAKEQALIDILKAHPNSTISEMKMHIGSQNRNNVPHALNGLRVKGVLQHTDEKPPRYSLSDHQ
jgi:SOS-response transcriptional repressor LexA